MPKEFPEIYFSYAWGDPKQGKDSIEYFIDELYNSLIKAGYPVKRDKMDTSYGDLISEFMRDIGEADLVVIGISDKYLRSHYCMWELCEIYRNSALDAKKFIPKLLPIRIEDINFDTQTRRKYIEYWEERFYDINKFINEYPDAINAEDQKDQQIIRSIRNDFTAVIGQIKDINSLTKALLAENDFEKIKKEINSRTGLKPIKGNDFKNGKIVNNIPNKMQIGALVRCKIKIAREVSHLELDKDFKIGNFSEPENLAISELMKVELKGDTHAFEISPLTENEMYLEIEEATTWLFDVKPLVLGNHKLTLLAYTMKERGMRNSRYYEASIEVVTDGGSQQKYKVIDEGRKGPMIGEGVNEPMIGYGRREPVILEDSKGEIFKEIEVDNKKQLTLASYQQKQLLILNFIKDKGTQQYSVDQMADIFKDKIPSFEVNEIIKDFVDGEVFKKLDIQKSGYWIFQNNEEVKYKIDELELIILNNKNRRLIKYTIATIIALISLLIIFKYFHMHNGNKLIITEKPTIKDTLIAIPFISTVDTFQLKANNIGLINRSDTIHASFNFSSMILSYIIPYNQLNDTFFLKYDTIRMAVNAKYFISKENNKRWSISNRVRPPITPTPPSFIINKLYWSLGNVSIIIPHSLVSQNGRLYKHHQAYLACQRLGSGWRLPTDTEYINLMKIMDVGFINQISTTNLPITGPTLGDKNIFKNPIGRNIAFYKDGMSEDGSHIINSNNAYYWTFQNGIYFYVENNIVYRNKETNLNKFFSCKCVKEVR